MADSASIIVSVGKSNQRFARLLGLVQLGHGIEESVEQGRCAPRPERRHAFIQMLLRLIRTVDQRHFRTERHNEELVGFGKGSSEVVDPPLHVRHDVDHAAARIHQQADRRFHAVLFLENLNVLRLIVFVKPEIVLGQIGNETTFAIFHGREHIDEIDVDFQCLRKTQRSGNRKEQCCPK